MTDVARLDPLLVSEHVRRSLGEDLGRAGDITTDSVVSAGRRANGRIVSRSDGRLAGIDLALACFRSLDPEVEVISSLPDGADLEPGAAVLEMTGLARPLLRAERTALNWLGHLSGIATATRTMVRAVEGTAARVTCTRKTTPGLRLFEKYAVRVGGGRNHRFGLDDAVLIKDNHLALGDGVSTAVRRAREANGHLVRIEVEVETLEQLAEAIDCGADVVLLDNMPLETMRRAVALADGRVVLEASGGIDADTVAAVAATGVEIISCGAITHSARSLDLSMAIEPRVAG